MMITNSKPLYTLTGKSRDVETIIRLRSWMEDEVRAKYGEFSNTKLYTDYDAGLDIFEFKIVFFR